MPDLPAMVSEDHIKKLDEERVQKLQNIVNTIEQEREKSWIQKQDWLAVFQQCLSVQITCNRLEISKSKYKQWRNKDPDFCRNLNEIIADARQELMGSAIVRATGYVRNDSEGNVETDALGKPIYYNGSDSLARSLLGLDKPDIHKADVVPISVNINMRKLIGNDDINVGKLPEHVTVAEDGNPIDDPDSDSDPAA